MRDLAGAGLLVEALGVSLLTHRQRRIHEDFQELALLEQAAGQRAILPERRDEGGADDQARVHEQLGHFGDTADVFHAVGLGEAEIAIQAVAYVVAV